MAVIGALAVAFWVRAPARAELAARPAQATAS
jgi:hypothetical protein